MCNIYKGREEVEGIKKNIEGIMHGKRKEGEIGL
jgi:hypothetical protein